MKVIPQRYHESIDEYIDSVVESTTYRIDTTGDEEEEEPPDPDEMSAADKQVVSYFTSSDFRRLLFLGTSLLAVLTTIWHILYVFGVSHPYLFGIRFVATHFLLMGTVIFLSTLSSDPDRRSRWLFNAYTALMLVLLWAGGLYLLLNWETLPNRAGAPILMDVVVSAGLVYVTLEGARRVVGPPFVVLGLVAILYGLFGGIVPGTLGHTGLSFERLVTGVAVPDMVGIFGQFMDLSATLVTIFIFFGVFLLHLGGSDFFGDFAMKVAGKLRSGPAQVAIISSGFMGMLSGSAIANVAATGSFSIPLMKRLGYNEDFAGAVESVASTGGQITPPIMGAVAFIMAAIIGTSYFNILIAAAIPAFLYYLTLILTAHLRAVKLGFEPVPREDLVSYRSLLVRSYLFLPIVLIVVSLYQQPDQVALAALNGLLSMVVLYVLHQAIVYRTEVVDGVKHIGLTLVRGADSATRSMAAIMIVIAELAWIIEIITKTGILNKISSELLIIAEGNLLVLAIMAAAIGILFGFGMPTIAAYLFVALLAAPAMTAFGVDAIGAHMFVLYYAILSAISPPVAGACLVACGISRGNFLSTCKYAIRFALPAYLLPFLWVYNPSLIAKGPVMDIAMAFGAVLVAIVVMVSAFENFLFTAYTRVERTLAILAAAVLLVPSQLAKGAVELVVFGAFTPSVLAIKGAGLVLLGILLAMHLRRYFDERTGSFTAPWT